MNKTYRTSLLAAAALAAGTFLTAADSPKADVRVNFHEPKEFTDVRAHFGGDTDEHYLDQLAEHVKRQAARRLAPGQQLEVTFTDIDLAGDFLPAAANAEDIRVIKEIYIPRQTLHFRLTNESGEVVKEGERRLSDLNFMNNVGIIGRNEPLYYDKSLLTDWINREFK